MYVLNFNRLKRLLNRSRREDKDDRDISRQMEVFSELIKESLGEIEFKFMRTYFTKAVPVEPVALTF